MHRNVIRSASLLASTAAAAFVALASSAGANTGPANSLPVTEAVGVITIPGSVGEGLGNTVQARGLVARNGADDPAGHDRGDRRGRGRGKDDGPDHADADTAPLSAPVQIARNGADDPAGHDRGDRRGRGRGKDDGPNHA